MAGMRGMRVSGGELRGRRLKVPRGARDLRPTTERTREAVFSMLGDLSGLSVLDLFAGTGALAIEAVSRGAAAAVAVDIDGRPAEANVAELDLSDRVRVVRSDAERFLAAAEPGAFDLVLCDPPYRLAASLGDQLKPLLGRALKPAGRLMIETAARSPMPMDIQLPLIKERRYGETLIRIFGSPVRDPARGAATGDDGDAHGGEIS